MSAPHPTGSEGALDAEAVACLRRARGILFITGAGLSADSGLPTYRGIGGLYDRETTDEGLPIEMALSGEMLRRRPDLCWKYIGQIEAACRGAQPNRGHQVIAALEAALPRVWVLTQNVDGFHRAAGSRNLIEIHGNLETLTCTRCSHSEGVADFSALNLPPRCRACQAVLRPSVVLFGESLPPAAVRSYERELRAGFELVVSIGTTSVFPYIAGPVVDARREGRTTIEINPGDTEVSHLVTHRIRLGAAKALDLIAAAVLPAA